MQKTKKKHIILLISRDTTEHNEFDNNSLDVEGINILKENIYGPDHRILMFKRSNSGFIDDLVDTEQVKDTLNELNDYFENYIKKNKNCFKDYKIKKIIAVHFGGDSSKEYRKLQKSIMKVIEENLSNDLNLVYYSSLDNDNDFVKKMNLEYYNNGISDKEKFIELIKRRAEGEELKYFGPLECRNKLLQLWLPIAIDIQGLHEVEESKRDLYLSKIKEDLKNFDIKTKHDKIIDYYDSAEEYSNFKFENIKNINDLGHIISSLKDGKEIDEEHLNPNNESYIPKFVKEEIFERINTES